MFRSDFQSKKSQKELTETFKTYLNKQKLIESYPIELVPTRTQMVDWLIFLCHNLSFRCETLFRAVSIFDLYIAKVQHEVVFSIYELKLVAIASLSLATKIEEINCNFVNFLADNVLNGENSDVIYTSSDLTKKEIEILQKLNFSTNQSTAYQFLNVFQQICFNFLGEQNAKISWILNTSENLLTLVMKNENSIFTPPCEMAMIAMNQTLFQLAYTFNNENVEYNNAIVCNVISQIQKFNNNCLSKNDCYRREINSLKNNNNYFQAVCNF